MLRVRGNSVPPAWGCIYVDPRNATLGTDLCEEVYRAFLSFLGRGLKRIRVYVRASKAPDWMRVSSCVLTRNLIATVEVHSGDDISKDAVARECVEVVEVPVAPPTSLIRERRQVIPCVQ